MQDSPKMTPNGARTAIDRARFADGAEQRRASTVSESWVRPDGSIERNVRMDLVVSAAKKKSPALS